MIRIARWQEYAGLSVDRSLTCLVWMKENNLKKEEAAELARVRSLRIAVVDAPSFDTCLCLNSPALLATLRGESRGHHRIPSCR